MPSINVLAGGVVQAQNVNGGFYALGANITEFYNPITFEQHQLSTVGTYNLYGDINLTVYSTLKPFVFGIYDQYGDEPYYTEIVFKSVADSVEMSGGQSDTLRALADGQTVLAYFGYKYWYPDIIKVNSWFDGDNDVYQTGLYDPQFTYVPFTFYGVNDAPILADRSPTLYAVLEDALAPVDGQYPGTDISQLAIGVSDYDSTGYLNKGVAITGLDTTNGTWWYTTGLGTNYDWIQITGVVSESRALLLSSTASGSGTYAQLYFKPNADFNGTIANAVTFRGWDKTSGTTGTYVNITTIGTGGTTAFSTATDTASITVVAVNDAPRITALTTFAYTENQAVKLVAPTGSVVDVDNAFLNNGFLRVSFSANGTAADQLSIVTDAQVSLAGNIVSVGGVAIGTVSGGTNGTMLSIAFNNASAATPAAVTTLLQHIGYLNTSDDPSTAARTLSIQVSDGMASNSTGSASSTINVTATNDAPTASNLSQSLTVLEDTPSAALGIVVTDADAADIITAKLTLNDPLAGTLTTSGTATYNATTGIWQISGTQGVVNAALALVTFVPASASNVNTTITTHIEDAAHTGPANGTITLTITPLNDAPVLAAGLALAGITEEDVANPGQTVGSFAGAAITDTDIGALKGIAITGHTDGNGHWQYKLHDGGGWIDLDGVSGTAALLLRSDDFIRFVPDQKNATTGTLSYRAWDQTSGAAGLPADTTTNGGASAFSTGINTASIAVSDVDDLAIVTTTPVVTTETKLPSFVFFNIASKVAIADVDAYDAAHPLKYVAGSGTVTFDGPPPPDETLSDLLTLDPDTGTVLYDRSAFRWLADDQHVTYTITFRVQSGDDAQQETSLTITINGLNDAPVLFSPTHASFAATTEDSPPGAARTVASFRGPVTDGDPDALTGIAITATAGNGDWQYSIDNGAHWTTFSGSAAAALLLLDTDLVRFTPDGKNGGQASFTYRAWDQTEGTHGGTADATVTGGASAFSNVSDVVTIAVASINDAPVMTPDHMTLLDITEDETTNAGQPVWQFLCNAIGDVDAGAVQGIALSGTTNGNGHWEYSLDTGTTWLAVGVRSESAALLLRTDDLMRFVPDGKNGTAATLTYHAWDRTKGAAGDSVDLTLEGATGGTTAYSTLTDVVSIAVSDVNDAPMVTGPVTLAPFNEDTARVITLAELLGHTSDVDTGHTLSVTDLVLIGNGGLVDNGNDTWTYTPAGDDDTSVSFTYKVGDGIAAPIDTSATLDITPVNDAPVAQSGAAGGDEDTTISGSLVAADVDNPTLTFSLETQAAHGTVTVNPNGTYSYVPNANYFGTDSFTFRASDGLLDSVATVNLTVDSINDPPVVTGPVTLLAVKEDTARLITEAELLANSSDADGPLGITDLVLIGNGGLIDNGDDTWTYTPDADDDTSVSFTYKVGDGIAAAIATSASLDLTPVNDAPVSQNDIAGGDEDTTIAGALTATDVDNQSLSYSLLTQAAHGTVTVNPNGSYTYKPNANYSGSDSFTFQVFDGATTSSATVDLVVSPVNDAPVNIAPIGLSVEAGMDIPLAGLSITDVDAGAGALSATLSVTHGKLTIGAAGGAGISGNGSSTVTLTGTLATINATLAAAKNVIYHTDTGFTGTDTLTIATTDNGNAGAGGGLTDTDQVNLFWQHVSGAGGNDTFAALPGYERIEAGGGVDTVTFGFKLTDATITWVGNQVIVDTASSYTVLTGVETYVFTDGTVNNNDGDVLVDDLYYYATYHDVWNAHVDADAHYHGMGWKEWRDPSAFFSTSFYLAVNPDVNASGVDPLTHFHQVGWMNGRQPSMAFDTAAFLEANPDIAAAHIDPLAHFMQLGASEGRQPIALTELIAANGFDYVYYLQQNPDVAAAHVDPFQHFQTVGWKEGRDPNALFDTEGYLATYTDVKAAGINPLDHYHAVGWKEGRDPSVNFDTTEYVGHYFDIAVANIDPLQHFLRTGIHEGRSPFADGVWG